MPSDRFREIRTALLPREWIVSDPRVRQKSQNYRNDLLETYTEVEFWSMVEDVRRCYIQRDIKDAMRNRDDFQKIDRLFGDAIDNNDVKNIIRAYTSNGSFYKILNNHLASILRADNDERINMTKTVNMSYWQGPLDIVTMLVCHPNLEEFRFKQGSVFRGMRIDKDEDLLLYQTIGIPFLNKTFISTSKNREIAMVFGGATSDSPSPTKSCLFKYTFVESARRTALDIDSFSDFPGEEEVLILPYATFQVISYQCSPSNANLIEIELRECEPAECNPSNARQENLE